MDTKKVLEYTKKWISAKALDSAKGDSLTVSIASFSEQEMIRRLFFPFRRYPEYVAEVSRELGISNHIVRRLFAYVMETSLFWRPNLTPIDIPRSVPYHATDQIVLALKLSTHMTMLRREHRAGDILREDTEAMESVFRLMHEPLAIIELRAVALAFLSRALTPHTERSSLNSEVYEEFLSSLDEGQVGTVELILYHLKAPSLETMRYTIAREGALKATVIDEKTLREYETSDMLAALVLDPLNTRQCEEILETEWQGKKVAIRDFLVDFKLAIRLGVLPLHERELYFSSDFVTSTVNFAARSLRQTANEEWRIWAMLQRLTSLRWVDKPRNSSRGQVKLERSLARLCESLEDKISSLFVHWQVFGLIGRAAELNVDSMEDNLGRLLCLLFRMPNDPLLWYKGYGSLGMERDLGPEIVGTLLAVATRSGDLAFRGFLRWLAMSNYPSRMMLGERILPLQFDVDRAISVLKETDSIACRGASLLLSQSDSTSLDQAKQILEYSKTDRGESASISWGSILRSAAKELDDQEVTSFLESVFSARSNYPSRVKYSTLSIYEEIARSTTIDITEQEQDLGLPLQDAPF